MSDGFASGRLCLAIAILQTRLLILKVPKTGCDESNCHFSLLIHYHLLQEFSTLSFEPQTSVIPHRMPRLEEINTTRREYPLTTFQKFAYLALATVCLGGAGLFLKLAADPVGREDRKSTRLNSSHPSISYAVFCLK